MQYLAIRH